MSHPTDNALDEELEKKLDTSEVNGFEVIDHRTRLGGGVAGRVLVIDPRSPQELPTSVNLSVQDDGHTLKVFLSDPPPNHKQSKVEE